MRAKPIILLALLLSACGSDTPAATPDASLDGGAPDSWATRLQTFKLSVEPAGVDTSFDVRDHFMAAVEMQLSGEPFAEAMGRDLRYFSRAHLPTDIYFDPTIPGNTGRVDLAGFSTAVESYEYSKQPLNNVALESGAGLSSAFGPVTSPGGETGAAAEARLRTLVQSFGAASHATTRFIAAAVTPDNRLGWPGLWPTMMPFSWFDPHIHPSDANGTCSITSDDDPGTTGAIVSDDYECDYTGLHLPNRAAQTSGTVDPGGVGWHAWKAALWVLNYLEVMHDAAENPVVGVSAADLALVGVPGNTVVGTADTGGPSAPGVYLGSSDIEGFQAAMFIEMMNDQVEEWLTRLTTTDGRTLSGFQTLSQALAYSTASPPRWFPSRISVAEASDASGFPRPTSFAIVSADSQLLDLAGMLGAYATLYALTDTANAGTGGLDAARAYFDGSPFAGDDQLPNGQPTTHDRMLAVMRVLVVNIERLHRQPDTGLPVNQVTLGEGRITRGTVLSADVAAYTLLALRTARRSLDSELVLYSNTTPDTEGIPSPLDGLPPVAGRTFSAELDSLIASLSTAFYDSFTEASGVAYLGWDQARGAPTDAGTNLDAHTAAIRGLLVAYLATGDARYRSRATSVYQRLEAELYYPPARIYRATVGVDPVSVTFTPRRFGLLQGALRDMYELVGVNAGEEALAAQIEARVARLNKLVLNGWDDRDQDEQVEWPDECVRALKGYDGPGSQTSVLLGGQGHTLALGGLQMAERTLSGEIGSLADVPMPGVPRIVTTDRENDCVPEVSAVGLPAALANAVTFTLSPYVQ